MRFARHQLGLGALEFGDVVVDLQDRPHCLVVVRPRDPKARDRDERAAFCLLFKFALPAAALTKLGDDVFARRRIAGLEKLLDSLSQRFVAAEAV